MAVQTKVRRIKCVVWDLDNTVWDGVLTEESVTLKNNIIPIIKTLDERGILQSVSSKNDYDFAMSKLKEFGIDEYFIFPQINWGKKSTSLSKIARLINIGIDTLAFIDDQVFERDEINYELPEVLCIDALDIESLLDKPELNPKIVTEEARNRRKIYMDDIRRNEDESRFDGPNEEFLKTLHMKLTLSDATFDDLERARELTLRTNQLNATGYTYSIEELYAFTKSENHKLLVADLSDVYGSYGKIGLVLIEKSKDNWRLKLLILSCRIMSRGIGSVILYKLINMSLENNVTLIAEFIPTDRNRMMYVTYKFSGFTELEKVNDVVLLEYQNKDYRKIPEYIEVNVAI
ncbi:HAD-IIIC family phosphatase [Paucisalibacillus globulus]|uniref:HAD-IIIC family phosphatase n=1 Tax=Paucisalibacillus globulus TaxID=351095 RepID=UPI00042147FD|nr:HAD-IIIC family phosphatase [Paucisalibacillus globulus]